MIDSASTNNINCIHDPNEFLSRVELNLIAVVDEDLRVVVMLRIFAILL